MGFGHRSSDKDIGFKDIFHDICLAQRYPFADRNLSVEIFLVKGMDDVIAKPIPLPMLQATLSRWLGAPTAS